MNEAPISVSVILKTGHKDSFSAYEFKKTAEGWEFTSYPENRGCKSVRLVKADSVAAIEITAPNQFFEAATQAVSHPSPSNAVIVPQPQTYEAKKNVAFTVRTKDGTPRAVAT